MSFKPLNHKGFNTVEILLSLILVAIIGFTGLYVYNANRNASKDLKVTNDTPKFSSPVKTFADCKKAAGSKILETFPEQCVTKDGKSFTDTASKAATTFLNIPEWSVRIKVEQSYGFSAVSQYGPDARTINALAAKDIVGPTGKNCGDEYIAYIDRLKNDDPQLAKGAQDDSSILGYEVERKVVDNYTYILATKKTYGPECYAKTTSGDYTPDTATAQKFSNIVSAFVADFKSLEAY